jgi:hypothetical protein
MNANMVPAINLFSLLVVCKEYPPMIAVFVKIYSFLNDTINEKLSLEQKTEVKQHGMDMKSKKGSIIAALFA